MRASLYEALGIAPSASDEEVRSALRRLIRKYYAKTRDGQGNVEEALRFINHASRILSDPERRARYDNELALSSGTVEHPVAHVASNAIAAAGEQTDVGMPAGDSAAGRVALEADADDARDARSTHHPGLTEPVASFGRPTIVTIALCALFAAFIAAAIVLVMPVDTVQVAKQVLVGLTLTLLALTAVYGVVHGIAWARRNGAPPVAGLMPQTDLAILNWRREKSVFLGTNQPQEDASWIFQLRMAELERAKTGRTSEPRPFNRLAGRLFDYAIWGIVLALLLSELRGAKIVPDRLGFWLGHPLVAPMAAHHRDVDPDRGAADGLDRHHAGQVALRLLPSILDFRRLCPPGSPGPAPARAPTRVPRLVGRGGLRLPAARAGPDRRGLRTACANAGDRLGFGAGLPRHLCPARHAEYRHRRDRLGGHALALWSCLASSAGRHGHDGDDLDHAVAAVAEFAASAGPAQRQRGVRHRERNHASPRALRLRRPVRRLPPRRLPVPAARRVHRWMPRWRHSLPKGERGSQP